MNESPHVCVTCGENLLLDSDLIVVDVLPSPNGYIQRVVHKECLDKIKKDCKK